MDFINRAARAEVQEKTCPEGIEIIQVEESRNAEASWRRLGLRALVAIQTARAGVVLTEVRDVTVNPKKYETPVQDLSGQRGVSRAEILMRPPLTPSKSLRSSASETEACAHRWIMARGGKTFWFTCRMCPMRWPRAEGEYCQEPDSVPPGHRPKRPVGK